MRTLKNIWGLIAGIFLGICALVWFFIKGKPSTVKEENERINQQINANNEAIRSEEELREEIKKEIKESQDAEVTQDTVVKFFNDRKS